MNAPSKQLSDYKPRPARPAPKRMFVADLTDKSHPQHCVVHGEYFPLIGAPVMCPSCAVIQAELAEAAHHQALFNAREKARHAAAGVLSRHAHCGFVNYTQDLPGQRVALAAAKAYTKRVQSGQTGCLIMVGSTGTGKTHLSVSIIRNLMARKKDKEPLFARYATSADIANDILGAWIRERAKEGDNEKATLQRYVDPDVLVIDEVGLDDQRENQINAIHRVLTARYDAQKSTVVVSNLTTAKLQELMGDRLWSRLGENGAVVECNWADQRMASKGWNK